MRNTLLTILVAAILLIILAGIAVAQDEDLTLQSLADQLAALTTRVTALESIWEGPGVWKDPNTELEVYDDQCIIGLSDKMQNETILKFLEKYEDLPYRIEIDQVVIDPGSNSISLVLKEWNSSRYVVERWDGCEFVGSSDWAKR